MIWVNKLVISKTVIQNIIIENVTQKILIKNVDQVYLNSLGNREIYRSTPYAKIYLKHLMLPKLKSLNY